MKVRLCGQNIMTFESIYICKEFLLHFLVFYLLLYFCISFFYFDFLYLLCKNKQFLVQKGILSLGEEFSRKI